MVSIAYNMFIVFSTKHRASTEMTNEFEFTITRTRFDEDYQPSDHTRVTTNFANLARGKQRKANLRNALQMIDNRFNALATWDNAAADRYTVELDIISLKRVTEPNKLNTMVVRFLLNGLKPVTIVEPHLIVT